MSAAWRRFSVTRLALSQRRELCDELERRGHSAAGVIVADDENLRIAEEFGFDPVVCANDELGRKFNDGIEYAVRVLEADFVVHVGSDDWVHPSVFDRLPSERAELELPTPERPAIVGQPAVEIQACRRITFVDLQTGEMRICGSAGRFGVIPWIIPRVALERAAFRPCRDSVNRGIDGSLVRGVGMRRSRWTFVDPSPFSCVDWKSDTNLNEFDRITRALGADEGDSLSPWRLLEDAFGVELVDQARELAGAPA